MKKSYFSLPYALEDDGLGEDDHIRYPLDFAKKFIKEFTKENDLILDPFAGFGTTLIVAQELGRIGYGIEYEKKRCDFIQERISPPTKIIHGSALNIDQVNIPQCDFSITSPPYMRSFDNENPFSNYHEKGNYQSYLRDIGIIYKKISKIMKPNAYLVLEVSNTFGEGRPMTPLAWDIARELSKFLFFEREILFLHEEEKNINNQHSYCLLFRNCAPESLLNSLKS